MTVGLSRPVCAGFVSGGRTSLKLGELSAYEKLEVLEESSFSSGLASASFQSLAVSVSRVTFHELVAAGYVTAIERIFSTLKKSLFNHDSGLASMLLKGSDTTATI